MKRKLLALFELLRLPNLFTVPGDILVGWYCTGGSGNFPWWRIGASLCLYSAGLLFNDFFDAKIDAGERPARPIPSGRISRRTVGALGALLMVVGILLAWQAWQMALLLATLILAYDGGLKKIPFVGILTMGCCRGVNILLGASLLSTPALGFAAFFFTLYIVVVSFLARNEVHIRQRPKLIGQLIRFLIPLQFLFCFYHTPNIIEPLLFCTFALLWLGAEVTAQRFSSS